MARPRTTTTIKTPREREPLIGNVSARVGATGTTYRAVWYADKQRQTATFDSHDEACDFLDEQAIAINRGGKARNVVKSRQSFAGYAATWLADEAKDTTKKGTILRTQLLPVFGSMPIGEITRRDVQKWINTIAADPSEDCELCDEAQAQLSDDEARCRKHKGVKAAAGSSVHEYYSVLGKLMRSAQLDGCLPNGCPVGKGLHQLPDKAKRMVILNDDQSDTLLKVCLEEHTSQVALLHIACHTGMRIGELFGARRSAYNRKGRGILVDTAVKATGKIGTTKTNNSRFIDLDSCCIEVLDQHLAGHDHDMLFPSSGGMIEVPTNWRKRHWYPLREAAGLEGLDLHFHDLRHTHCTNLLAAGWPVVDVAYRMGHKSAKMTLDVYGHAIPGRQRSLLQEKGLRVGSAPTLHAVS